LCTKPSSRSKRRGTAGHITHTSFHFGFAFLRERSHCVSPVGGEKSTRLVPVSGRSVVFRVLRLRVRDTRHTCIQCHEEKNNRGLRTRTSPACVLARSRTADGQTGCSTSPSIHRPLARRPTAGARPRGRPRARRAFRVRKRRVVDTRAVAIATHTRHAPPDIAPGTGTRGNNTHAPPIVRSSHTVNTARFRPRKLMASLEDCFGTFFTVSRRTRGPAPFSFRGPRTLTLP
jgi:hypothetical protein